MAYMRSMASTGGQTVIASIHQPRAAIWQLFDKVRGGARARVWRWRVCVHVRVRVRRVAWRGLAACACVRACARVCVRRQLGACKHA
jgi:hypothetical protein